MLRSKNTPQHKPWTPTWRFIVTGVVVWLTVVMALPGYAQNNVTQYDRAGNGSTFFTASEPETQYVDAALSAAYKKQGVTFAAHATPKPDTVPVHRFYNPVTLAHFYTASEAERKGLVETDAGKGWLYEGISFYAYLSPGEGRVAVNRFWFQGGGITGQGIHRYLVGSTTFPLPPLPTSVPLPPGTLEGVAFYGLKVGLPTTPKAGRDAARFLTQATFGIKNAAQIEALERDGYASWINAQFTIPATSATQYLRDIEARGERVEEQHPYEAVWQQLLFGEDQLRARVTFALSQTTVISNVAPDQNNWALVSWWDMLGKNAFSSYRQLLEDVTLHPGMGYYLNMLGNQKEDPATNRNPNENFAREVLQLFSIGLVELNLDGTPKRDASGKTIPTYDQKVVEGFAKVFTGWSHAGNDTKDANAFFNYKENWQAPMQAWPMHHSEGAKTILGGVTVPAKQTPEKDLNDALDVIANHPNVGPFIGKRLIQALVTSNPSPAYVERVARMFNNNGGGVRGDLKAVIRAVLLDTEARTPPSADAKKYGKQREPVLRFTQLMRAANAKADNGRNSVWWLDSADDALGQSPLLAPSVFNFFSPLYTRAGPIAQAGLVAPEFQITTEAQVVGATNFLHNVVSSEGFGYRDEGKLKFNLANYVALESKPSELVDALALLFTNGQLSDASRSIIIEAVEKVGSNAGERSKIAMRLLIVTPDFTIQR
jgi:endo-chitodextinase